MFQGLVKSVKSWLGKPIATPDTDPAGFFFGKLAVLPNPDPMLRAMGRIDVVHASIMADPHVMGELRSIRGSFRKHQYRVLVGDADDTRSVQAKELCEAYLASSIPNNVAGDWLEVMWQMAMAMFYGFRPHEAVWDINTSKHPLLNGKLLPSTVVDRPGRRVQFDRDGNPLLISRGNWQGAPVEPYQLLISRHMPTMENPYGLSIASSLFWVWTFKTGGWRFLYKYCERHGIPWPVARYPQGTPDGDIDKLAEAMEAMLESAYAVVQEGTGVELLVPKGGTGDLPQERLIDRCNREMSKALNSQAMVAELGGVGSCAASETAAARQEDVNDADRDIAAGTMSRLLHFITMFNFGDDVAPPTLELYRRENAGKERVEAYDLARKMGARPSKKGFLEETGIAEAEDDADALLPDASTPPPEPGPTSTGRKPTGITKEELLAAAARAKSKPHQVEFSADQVEAIEGWSFARSIGMTEAEAIELASQAADDAIEKRIIAPVYQMLVQYERDGKTLADFQADLGDIVDGLDEEGLREVLERAMTFAILRGAATQAD